MKVYAAGLLLIIFVLSSSLVAFAVDGIIGEESYYSENLESITYTVYDSVTIESYRSTMRSSMYVERLVVYEGTSVIPSKTIRWEEKTDGIIYMGILTLSSTIYNYNENITTCRYAGTLSSESR